MFLLLIFGYVQKLFVKKAELRLSINGNIFCEFEGGWLYNEKMHVFQSPHLLCFIKHLVIVFLSSGLDFYICVCVYIRLYYFLVERAVY